MEPALREMISSFRVAEVHTDETDLVTAKELIECFSNQKVLAGAFEMWAVDKEMKWREITPLLIEELRKGEYVEASLDDPGQGAGTTGNYHFVDTGNHVACRVHGSVDGAVLGTKPPPEELPDPPLDFCLYREMTGDVAKENCQKYSCAISNQLKAYCLVKCCRDGGHGSSRCRRDRSAAGRPAGRDRCRRGSPGRP